MKKILLFLGCLSLLAAGCNKVQPVEVPEEEVPELKFNITVTRDDDTRAVKRGWEVGDEIYIAFDISFLDKVGSIPTGHGYVSMDFNGNRFDTPIANNNSFMKALLASSSGKLAAVFFSGGQTPDFEFEDQGTVKLLNMTNNDRLGGFFLLAHEVPYTIENNTLTADIHLKLYSSESYAPVHFFLPGISASKAQNYSLRCTRLCPDHFTRFTFVDMSHYSSPNLGPWATEIMGSFGEPMYGSYYSGGLEYVGYIDSNYLGAPTDYYIVVVDDKGTPDNASDDVGYGMVKSNVALDGKEAIKLPALTNSAKWTVFNPLGIDVDFNGYGSQVQW
jgi:hypothetical protein